MASRPPSPQPDRVDHYCKVLRYCLDQCADHRTEGHDVLLWNARRASESILYALAEGTEAASALHKQFDEQKPIDHHRLIVDLERLKRLHSTVAKQLQIVRQAGNLGAHTQAPEVLIDETTLKGCLGALAEAVEWFCQHSELASVAPRELRKLASELTSPNPRPSPRDAHENAILTIERDRDRLRDQHAAARGEVERLRDEVRRLSGSQRALPPGHEPTPAWRGIGAALRVGLVGALFGLGVGFWAGGRFGGDRAATMGPVEAVAGSAAEPPVASGLGVPSRVAASSPPVLPTVPPEPASTSATAPATAPATTASSVGPSCPEGMRLFAAGTLSLDRGPHPRRDWPAPERRKPGRLDVAPFCLDPAPVTTSAFLGAAPAETKKRRSRGAKQCNTRKDGGALPTNCVSAEDAARHCGERGLRLPTVGEWEVAVRAVPPVRLSPDTGEWASDSFPPTVFGYREGRGTSERMWFDKRLDGRPADEPRLSWHHRAKDDATLPKLSFRCARDAVPGVRP